MVEVFLSYFHRISPVDIVFFSFFYDHFILALSGNWSTPAEAVLNSSLVVCPTMHVHTLSKDLCVLEVSS